MNNQFYSVVDDFGDYHIFVIGIDEDRQAPVCTCVDKTRADLIIKAMNDRYYPDLKILY